MAPVLVDSQLAKVWHESSLEKMSRAEQLRIPQEVLGFLCPGTAPRDGEGPLPPDDSLCLLSQFRHCQEAEAGRLDFAPDKAVHSPCCFPAPKLEEQEFS